MEEFLPANKTVQSLESGTVPQASLGTLSEQASDRHHNLGQVFSLYLAVITQKRANMVAPMVYHLHAVIKLHQSMRGMVWLQYDWKARREVSAEPSTSWNPWQLLSCFLGTTGMEDLFDLPTTSLTNSPLELPKSTGGNASQLPSRTQPYPLV